MPINKGSKGRESDGGGRMTKTIPDRNAFSKQIEALRRHQGPLKPTEIAKRALKAGLQPHEALQEIRDYLEYRYARSPDPSEALALFVSMLSNHKPSDLILEYTSLPFWLTTRISAADAAGRLSIIAPDKQFAETLRILFAGQGTSIFGSVANLSEATTYGSMVCVPPLGLRPPDNSAADGFGGEIIRELVPYLSKEGTLYWITGRGVLFNQRAKQTLAHLQVLNLHLVGCIEAAPGVFPGTMIEGVVVIFQHGMPKKRFVGALRDSATAESDGRCILIWTDAEGRAKLELA